VLHTHTHTHWWPVCFNETLHELRKQVVTSANRRTSSKTLGSSANTIAFEVTNTRGSKTVKSILSYLKIFIKKERAITNISFASASLAGFQWVSGKFIIYKSQKYEKKTIRYPFMWSEGVIVLEIHQRHFSFCSPQKNLRKTGITSRRTDEYSWGSRQETYSKMCWG